MKNVIGLLVGCIWLMRVNAAEPWQDTLRYPTILSWPGSLDNAISILDGDATGSNPPYHREVFKAENGKGKNGETIHGYHIVFTRPDHVIEFHIVEVKIDGCPIVSILKHGTTMEEYQRVKRALDAGVPPGKIPDSLEVP